MNDEFSPNERARARAYHRPLYLALLADVVVAVGLPAALAWSSLGDWLFSPLTSLGPVAAAAGLQLPDLNARRPRGPLAAGDDTSNLRLQAASAPPPGSQ